MDNGADTKRIGLEIDKRFGGRVRTELLGRTELEAYYHRDAVSAWLRMNGASQKDIEESVAAALDGPSSAARSLMTLARMFLDRDFVKVEDGRSIAHLSNEATVDPEIKGLLTRLAS